MQGTSSVSVPLGAGIRYRVGGVRGRSVVVGSELIVQDAGGLHVTNQRVVFTGTAKTLEFRNDRMVGLEQFNDGLRLSVSNRQTASLFKLATPSIAAALITASVAKAPSLPLVQLPTCESPGKGFPGFCSVALKAANEIGRCDLGDLVVVSSPSHLRRHRPGMNSTPSTMAPSGTVSCTAPHSTTIGVTGTALVFKRCRDRGPRVSSECVSASARRLTRWAALAMSTVSSARLRHLVSIATRPPLRVTTR